MNCFGLKSKTGIILEVKTKRISGSGLNIKGGKCENGKGYICKRLRVFTGVPHTQSACLKTSTPLNASLVPALPSRTLWAETLSHNWLVRFGSWNQNVSVTVLFHNSQFTDEYY